MITMPRTAPIGTAADENDRLVDLFAAVLAEDDDQQHKDRADTAVRDRYRADALRLLGAPRPPQAPHHIAT